MFGINSCTFESSPFAKQMYWNLELEVLTSRSAPKSQRLGSHSAAHQERRQWFLACPVVAEMDAQLR